MQKFTATHIKKELSPSMEAGFIYFSVSEPFTFKEGQFIQITATVQKKTLKRSYSIATTYEELVDKKVFGIIVKDIAPFGMSHFLVHDINIGEEIECIGGLGHYHEKNTTNNNILFISTGSGIGPNYSMYKKLLSKNFPNKICNIFGERYEKQLISSVYNDFLLETSNIKNIITLSKEEIINKNYKKGHIQDHLEEGIKFVGENTTIYICGSPIMVDDVRKKLLEKGFDKEKIIIEKY